MTVEEIIESIINQSVPDMEETPYTVLFEPTKDRGVEIFSQGLAIDVTYKCPKCGTDRAQTWIFPDAAMTFTDECCDQVVLFNSRGEEE